MFAGIASTSYPAERSNSSRCGDWLARINRGMESTSSSKECRRVSPKPALLAPKRRPHLNALNYASELAPQLRIVFPSLITTNQKLACFQAPDTSSHPSRCAAILSAVAAAILPERTPQIAIANKWRSFYLVSAICKDRPLQPATCPAPADRDTRWL